MFLTQLFNGLALGMVYALVAIGYSLVFGILEMINFAHGATYAFGAILSWFLVTVQGWNVVPACGLSIETEEIVDRRVLWAKVTVPEKAEKPRQDGEARE